ncbi:FAD-dependent oxidoreductase [Mycobacterium sp. NPDC006124]|uniref:NAD(P)/FAD-dependent oxidoreductase n=1 Tax=Mycobacterium sp. NPDC006124 TaxID=3156729 RepID=UPI0033A26150
MSDTTTFLVVGGGLEGLAIAYSLAERGETDVVVLERDTLCSGMTAKSSGVVRCHYGTPSLAAMAWYGIDVFTHATELFGDDISFRQCGYLVGVGENNVKPLEATVAMMTGLGITTEFVDHDTVADLWPGMYLDDFARFAYEPLGGRGEAYMTGMAFAATARKMGVTIRQGTMVTELLTDHEGSVYGVTVADGSQIHADHVILANGPWAPALAAGAGVDIDVKAQRAQLVLVDQGMPTPDVPVLSDLAGLQYICREPNGELLVGNSDHQSPEFVDPDRYVNRADDDAIEKNVVKLGHRLPDMPDPRITSSYVGAYDVTPDYNPIIGPSPVDGLFLATGFSGHGFKISPAVGKLVADLLVDGRTALPHVDTDDFRYSRFAEGDSTISLHPYEGAGEMR